MKRLPAIFLIMILTVSSIFSQVAQSSWNIGFGFAYPRYQSSDLRPLQSNYGGFLSFQRNFSENVALRLYGFYYSIDGRVPGGIYFYDDGTIVPSEAEELTNTLFGANLEVLYYFAPCNVVSPYGFFGVGGVHFDPDWKNIINISAEAKFTAQINFGVGIEWGISEDFKLKTEFDYHSLDGQVDGIVNNNRQGIFGSNADAYITFDLGFVYYFGKGEPSKYCQLYSGIRLETPGFPDAATRGDVEEIVKKYIPKEVVKEVVVEKPVDRDYTKSWVLVGVNFDFGSANLRPESYPILFHAVQVLLQNPGMEVEIQGHTDNIGTEKANQKLSEKRAETVKNYLVARGVAANRLKTIGYGETKPISDNATSQGRDMNRRIEFRVLN